MRFRPLSWLLAALMVTCVTISAQVILDSGPVVGAGTLVSRHVVRDANGVLYSAQMRQNASLETEVVLFASADLGATWADLGVIFNDPGSGLSASNASNNLALAIDDQSRLHIVFGSYYYPSYYKQYYRSYEPLTALYSPIVDLSAQVGASTSARTAGMDIAVDAVGTVWIVSHGPSSWTERLLRSTAPYAAGGTFTDLGGISPSASAQNSRIAIDAAGLVHCVYYRNTGSGVYEHRVYDPTLGWQASTVLGNTTPTRDLYGRITSDALGNVHALWVEDADNTTPWNFRYARWDAVNGWSAPTTLLMTLQTAQYSGITGTGIFDLACDESSGTVWVAYRDLELGGGALRLALKSLTDTSFTVIRDITAPSLGTNAYLAPAFRGRLYPAFDNTGSDLDLSWQFRAVNGTPPYELYFEGNLLGGSQILTVTQPAPIALGQFNPVLISSPGEAFASYFCGFSESATPGLPLPGGAIFGLDINGFLFNLCLTANNGIFVNNFGLLDANATAIATVFIPNDPIVRGFSFYTAALTGNALGLSRVSQTLTITIP